MRNQLQVQAHGLSGHIDEFWPDLGANSGWLGGSGESWERGPYYLDGLIPLAYLLQDARLQSKAATWIDWILDHPHENGWLGPIQDPHESYHPAYDPWPLSVLCKGLTQYHEATGDLRIIPAMKSVFRFLADHLEAHPLSTWAEFRWGELVLSILWLYERTAAGDLLELAETILDQGFNWSQFFSPFTFKEKIIKGEEGYDFRTHGVNIAMGLKSPGIRFLFSSLDKDRQTVHEALEALDLYHGQVTGVFSSDGHLAGVDPWQGTELCTVVETMFSLEVLISILGECHLADRLEKIAFNALPAAFAPDMWSHQYDQQVNQVLCTIAPRDWTTNWDDSNIFGLEPSFGCCTANMHQGWPKFAQHLWMGNPEGGVALVAYAPSEVTFKDSEGQKVRIRMDTEYPFNGSIQFKIQCDEPSTFPFKFRIPSWCPEALLISGGDTFVFHNSGQFNTLRREWHPEQKFELHLQMPVEVSEENSGGICISRGPVIFALKVEETWKPLEHSPPLADRNWSKRVGENWVQQHTDSPHGYFEVLPASPWNYGLSINRQDVPSTIVCREKGLGDRVFSPEGSPIEMIVAGCKIPEWTLVNGSAGPIPKSIHQTKRALEDLTLIPYGCTNLRVTVFPEVEVEQDG